MPAVVKGDEPTSEKECAKVCASGYDSDRESRGRHQVPVSVAGFLFSARSGRCHVSRRSEPHDRCRDSVGLDDDWCDEKRAFFATRRSPVVVRAVCTLGVVKWVGGQHQQAEALDVEITELDMAVEGQHPSIMSPEMKEHQGVDKVRAPPKTHKK